jgi:hypothetical protein
MRLKLILVLCSVLLAGPAGAAKNVERDWKTYRSEKFGYEIACPAGMEFKAYFDGASASLKDAWTGETLVEFEVWPPFECPRQPADTVARSLGIDRAKTVTQADGPEGSSYCGDPATVHEFTSLYGVKIYELELTCLSETYPESQDDSAESGREDTKEKMERIVTEEGKKGPTYFADISPSWKKVVLLVDPVGADPRKGPVRKRIDPAVLRNIMKTLKTIPIQKPPGSCSEELRNQGLTIGIPRR